MNFDPEHERRTGAAMQLVGAVEQLLNTGELVIPAYHLPQHRRLIAEAAGETCAS